MASELEVAYLTGQTIYFLVRNSVGQIYNGATFENFNAGNYAAYPITGTEQGAAGYYTGTFPAVAAGVYNAEAKLRAGGFPAQSDFNVGSGDIMWDGSAVANLSAYAIALLKQNWVGITGESNRSVLNAQRKLRNKWDTTTTPGKLTVFKEDDTTPAYTEDITTDPAAEPITRLTPS